MINQSEYIPDAHDDLEGVPKPSEIQNLLGHDLAFEKLIKAYKNDRLHHAWLLSGPRGIGKASLAYRFAKHLLQFTDLAKAPSLPEPVDDSIHSIVSKGAHPNIFTLSRPFDPKSKKFKSIITVDEVRRLSAFLQKASGVDAWRVCIVDPADDMNAAAANALLKVLEEPPNRALFMVIAHSPRGLLPTIRSRCQMLPLKPLGGDNLQHILSNTEATNALDGQMLKDISDYSNGSARKAILLSQSDVVKTFNSFINNINNANPDITEIHRISSSLSTVKKEGEYHLFFDLIYDHINKNIRHGNIENNSQIHKSLKWSDVWDKTVMSTNQAETWNMDKKQVILDLFMNMRTV